MIVEATYTKRDKEGEEILGDDGKPIKRTYSCDHGLGENLVGLFEVCGGSVPEDAIDAFAALAGQPAGMKLYYNARGKIVVALQSAIRNWLGEDLSDSEIDSKVAAWDIPEGSPRTKDPMEKAEAVLKNLTDEQLDELIAKREAAAAG